MGERAGAPSGPPSREAGASAAALFARWMEDRSADASSSFERLLAEHPEAVSELHALREDWRILAELRESPSLARRLSAPRAAPSGAEAGPDGCAADAAELLERLGRRPSDPRYRIEGEVARGGQGAVVLVWDADLRRNLAMKVMLEPAEIGRPLVRFLEEAQVTSQLDHPGIVPVHELGLDPEGRVYFTMKLVHGEDLRAILAKVHAGRDGWTRTRALGVLLKVCEAMAYAHAKGVVHRDLKPGNVMVGRFGEVYVMDWGLARVRGRPDERDLRVRAPASGTRSVGDDPEDSPVVTMDGDVIGTPAYMAPEQALGHQPEVGPHSDVHAVGAILYHLLAGHMPYERPGERVSSHALWSRVLAGPPEPIQARARDSPAELVAICEKAMARDPRARYPDMAAFAEDLRAFLEDRVVAAHRTGALAELGKWVRRNRALAASLAAGILALAVGLVSSLRLKATADENAQQAEAREHEAQENSALAERRWQDVRRLSALEDLADLLSEAEVLWPALPSTIPRLERWIERAHALLDDLPLHVEQRATLRAHALPLRPEDREAHPDLPALRKLEGEIDSRERALARRRDGVTAALPEVDWSLYPDRAAALNAIAQERVEMGRRRLGEEPLGLALALRALELADQALRPHILDTVAQAQFALGSDDEALNASAEGLELAPENRRPQFGRALARMEESVERLANAAAYESEERELTALRARRDPLRATVAERIVWRFPEEERESRWWNGQLTKLIGGLAELAERLAAPDEVTPEHGWSVPRRLAFARRLEQDFAPGGEHARAWEQALPALRARYGPAAPEVVIGLVPLGPDLASGLWEFAHLASGEPPERDALGHLVVTEESGLVLELLPGGDCALGAQPGDAPALTHEGPARVVTLSPFFLSKFEMTQAQWLRFTGSNASAWGRDGTYGSDWNRSRKDPDLLHPVEQTTWNACRTVCHRLGLELPTEAQWEYAARAGTTTPWWTGRDPAALEAAANVADAWARMHGGPPGLPYEDWDDGQTAHAPVGSFAANPFGLHDVHGNVWEWCLDGWDPAYHLRSSDHDPWTDPDDKDSRIYRGGSCSHAAVAARSAYRAHGSPDLADGSIGLRPARALR